MCRCQLSPSHVGSFFFFASVQLFPLALRNAGQTTKTTVRIRINKHHNDYYLSPAVKERPLLIFQTSK